MAELTKRVLDCDNDGEGERGERGERGKRGKRGQRGHDGHDGERGQDGRDSDRGPTGPAGGGTGFTGPTGPTGPTGATGATGTGALITHVEDQSRVVLPLAPLAVRTTVLVTPPITAPVGSIVEISAMVNYSNRDNTTGFATVLAVLVQDGVDLAVSVVNPAARPRPVSVFDMDATLPIVWYLAGDGLPHVYAVRVQTDPTADGIQTAGDRAIFVNVIGP